MFFLDLASAYLLLLWHMFWPITFGLALSAFIRGFVPSSTITKRLGNNNFSNAVLAFAFGMVSSICNYAAIGMGHTLRRKGASWPNALIYMITCTDMGISMLVAIYGFLGLLFLEVMILTTLLFLLMAYLLCFLLQLPPPNTEISDDISAMNEHTKYQQACISFFSDVSMVGKDILVGLLVASAISVAMAPSWWQILFWVPQGEGGLWSQILLFAMWNGVVGVLIAILSFGCSIGNVSLAAVMWWNGVPPSGVMTFLCSGLLTLPMLKMAYSYYGLNVAIRQAIAQALAILLAAVAVDLILYDTGLTLMRTNVIENASAETHWVTMVLNVVFGVMGAVMYFKGKKLGGGEMSM